MCELQWFFSETRVQSLQCFQAEIKAVTPNLPPIKVPSLPPKTWKSFVLSLHTTGVSSLPNCEDNEKALVHLKVFVVTNFKPRPSAIREPHRISTEPSLDTNLDLIMGRRNESKRHDRDEVNIEFGRNPRRSSFTRHAHSPGYAHGGKTSTQGSGVKISLRMWVCIVLFIEV